MATHECAALIRGKCVYLACKGRPCLRQNPSAEPPFKRMSKLEPSISKRTPPRKGKK